MLFGWLGMAFGAWQGGLFYDLCGDYYVSFANASVAGVVNLLILALLSLYTRPTAGAWPAARTASPARPA